ncbi:DUF3253 domain-containing protein [Nesterenkonia sandarakina]|uniref:Uncharacterized protein DUF3253 n=1 Tax=Nesterenkonia sandarakina TaxID=272918 RepID=A0A2T0YIG6_9MICC|nr:DUF3253 domain-containing protein [Nesterenkonia sandarakina]PRZ14915.1 uncharacterized protein DUF3253 [Nesterenkonia sandarakina]
MDEPLPAVSDRDMERAILDLLAQRAETATICPSEAARAVAGDDWRDQMDAARSAAQRLVAAGSVDITQRGVVVDLATARGPIRIRRRPSHPGPR